MWRNSHETYDQECERARLTEIICELAKPLYLVRFNPDQCNDLKSCFGTTFKNGELKLRHKEWAERSGALFSEVDKAWALADTVDGSEMQFWGVRLYYPSDPTTRAEFSLPGQCV